MSNMIMMVAGGVIGSALGGSFMGGVPFMDVAKSMQGSLGFMLGHGAGMFVGEADESFANYAPTIGSIAVPLVLGGTVDRALIGVVGGGLIGIYLSGAHSKKK